MLNGKFFTGLPPKMVDRSGAPAKNRLESHLFWPDDTKAEAAVGPKVRRRASLQLDEPQRPLLQSQSSLTGGGQNMGVDTKQRFHKEFAKSSIQFYDNIQEDDDELTTQIGRRPHAYRVARPMKQGISPKPTATKLPLPECVIDGDYTAAKKQQTLNSKIRFYDFEDEGLNNRNNVRTPKLDMNNKREVERNTKNSPKLQVKRDVRNLSAGDEERKNNDYVREQYTPERTFGRSATPQRIIRNPVFEDQHYAGSTNRQESPTSRYGNDNNHRNSNNIDYDYEATHESHNNTRNRYDVEEHRDSYENGSCSPKKILRNATAVGERKRNDFARHADVELFETSGVRNVTYGGDEEYRDMDHLEHDLRHVRLGSPTKKHVSYRDELYGDEFHEQQFNNDADDSMITSTAVRSSRLSTTAAHSNKPRTAKSPAMPNMSTGSNRWQQFDTTALVDTADYEPTMDEVLCENMEAGSNSNRNSSHSYGVAKNSVNYNFNNNNRSNQGNNNNKLNNKQSQSQSQSKSKSPRTPQKITPKITAAAAESQATSDEAADARQHQHLHSNITFYNGEIVATTKTPTTTNNRRGTPRRNARSSATQRVSVGLPD